MSRFTWIILPTLLLLPTLALAAELPESFTPLMKPYETIRLVLVHDSVEGVSAQAERLFEAAEKLASDPAACVAISQDKTKSCQESLPMMTESAKRLAEAEGLDATRTAFEAFSKAAIRFRGLHGTGPAVAYCPMVKKQWLQAETQEIGNPFAGQSMPKCGKFLAR